MDSQTAAVVFITTGTILFTTILMLKRTNIFIGLILAMLSIFWAVLAFKYWAVTFPEKFEWMGIFIPIIGILSAMSSLSKGSSPAKEK